MSILRVANVHFESTGANRIDYVGDTINIVAGGTVVISANQSQGLIVGRTNVTPAFDQANTAYTRANGAYINVQTFTANGTWNKPSGYSTSSRVQVQLWGAGGSGARVTGSGLAGGGGGGGAYSEGWFTLSSLGASETVVIGLGGAAATSNAANGTMGGNTRFGTYAMVSGGLGGIWNNDARSGGSGGSPLNPVTGLTINPGVSLSPLFGTGQSTANTGNSTATDAESAFGYNSGSGGGGVLNNPGGSGATGGNTVFGGAGGGGAGHGSGSFGVGGYSAYGGNGGAAGTTGTAGSEPGGGGGGSTTGNSGAGANGRAIITVYSA